MAIAILACGWFGPCLSWTPAQELQPEQAAQEQSAPAGAFDLPESLDQACSLLQNIQLERLFQANSLESWLAALVAITVGLVAGKSAATVLAWLGRRFERRGWAVWQHLVVGLAGPASLFLLAAGLATGTLSFLKLGDFATFWQRTLLLVFTISVLWYAYDLVPIAELMVRRLTTRTGSVLDQQLAPMIRKILRIFLVVMGVLFIVDSVFDQDIGAWLAGLGIAGLAVSLAAQDSLKSLFGSLTILVDRPFRVGERIVYAGYDGTIEEIGFRSTKVRTVEGHLVTIPNSVIVNEPIQNIGRRPHVRRAFNVAIPSGTPRARIAEAIQILRRVLAEPGIREPIHPKTGSDEFVPRVHFNEFNAESLNIQVVYWHSPPVYWDYLEHAQRLNLRIFEAFEKAGIEFASPGRKPSPAGDSKRQQAPELLEKELR
ncbi:MAG: mechanosensitive ion channel family protein [Pirellulales bacterium]|nr:mechanosensitive ion channel family protein [Pirellulales bacterium]